MVAFPGPDCLGRGLVVRPGQAVPEAFRATPRVRVDERVLERPEQVLSILHRAWAGRERIVVELGVEADVLRQPEAVDDPPCTLQPGFEFKRERLHFLVWANNYDATRGEPIWWHARVAEKLGARLGSPEDVQLPSGHMAWCDGGPRAPLPVPVVHRESLELRCLALAPSPVDSASELAADQLAAVRHGGGPARIIAPAGSGKTRVLTERLRHLLVDRGYERDLITAVAYNKRAADELKQRTASFQPRIQTLHALGFAILNRQAPRQVLDEYAVRQVLRTLVTIDPQPNQDPMASYVEALSQVRIGLVRPDEVERQRDDVTDFNMVFRRYRAILAERRVVDHDEQIYAAIELLLSQPQERRHWQRQCRHLLVDEFQDLTPAYLLLIRLLAAPGYQVFGVGDDDQVIYGYVGATPDYLIRYEQYFPSARVYALETNYRCPAVVVQSASTLLAYNQRRVAKAIRCGPLAATDAGAMRIEQRGSGELAQKAIDAVKQWLDMGTPPTDIAVLTRVNTSLLPVQICLMEAAFPCRTAVNLSLLNRTGIRSALSYLRLAQSYPDMRREDIVETIRRPARKIGRSVGDLVGNRTHWNARDLARAAHKLQRWEQDRLKDYLDDVERLAEVAGRGTARDVLRCLRTEIGLDQALQTLDSSSQNAWTASHVDDLKVLEQAAALHPQVATFEAWLHERLAQKGEQGITLSTIHRVKGMEWACVVLLDVSDGLIPHRLSQDPEEERRVFHVGITRARRELLLLVEKGSPSSFLDELRQLPRPLVPVHKKVTVQPVRGKVGVVAELGLEIGSLGMTGVICELHEDFVLMRVPQGGRITVRYGERVRTAQGTQPLLKPQVVADTVDDETQAALLEGLRQWRREMAQERDVPPYLILNDKHMKGLAESAPRTMQSLARCKGMGPARLEAYGDQLLALIETVLQIMEKAGRAT